MAAGENDTQESAHYPISAELAYLRRVVIIESTCQNGVWRYTYFWKNRGRTSHSRRPVMFSIRSTASHFLLAFAFAGFVFPATLATACDSGMESAPTPKCCATKRSASCGCCVPALAVKSQSPALTTPVRAGSPSALSLPETTGCECRPVDSAPANSKPESRPTMERQFRSYHVQADPDRRNGPIAPPARGSGLQIPPRLHVYLLTARLLI
jgi:hypothetical protein